VPADAAILLGLDRRAILRILEWRGRGLTAPIIVIGGTDPEIADAFRAGADNALPAISELVAARAVELARAPRLDAVLQNGDTIIDLARGTVRRGDRTLTITVTEARLLRYLAARPGRPISQEELLRDVWGYAPTVTSRVVRVTIQRLRRKIERDPSNPTFVLSDIGRGYRFAVADRAVTAVDGVVSVRSNVVIPDDTFIGGTSRLAAVDAAIRRDRAVALVGPGGVGKTRLARQYAAGLARAAREAIWEVDLSDAPGLDQVLGRIAEAVGVPLAGLAEAEAADRLRDALRAHPTTLLALDACERLDPSVLDHIAGLIHGAPNLAILITTRVAPGDGFVRIEVDPLPPAEGYELLVDRARRRRSTFPINDAIRAACVQIVDRLDALPLALELAASRLAILDPWALLTSLDRQFGLLSDPSRPDRSATLRASITASWELLPPTAQAAAGALSICEGGFDFAAAQAITGLGAVDCANMLTLLLGHSLLRADTARDGTLRRWRARRCHLRGGVGGRLQASARAIAHRADRRW
jgi:predicted ATPase/DNA-binding response OmpR family regulator